MKNKALCLLLACFVLLCGCEKEEITPEVTKVVETSKVTNAIADTTAETTVKTRVYTDSTESTGYTIVTEPVVTVYVPPITTEEDTGDVTEFTFTETVGLSFTQQAVVNIFADMSWAEGISKMRISFCDLNLDGVPEMLVTDMNKMTVHETYDVFETKVYDLKTMQCLSTFNDMARTSLTCFKTPEPHWGFGEETGYYSFNADCSITQVFGTEMSENGEELLSATMYGEPITVEEFNSNVSKYFNYGDTDTTKKVTSCEKYITEENMGSASDYITEAIVNWCILNSTPNASVIQ